MAKKEETQKFDPNKEAFQMRAQWKKQDMCRKLWFERWSWLLEERNFYCVGISGVASIQPDSYRLVHFRTIEHHFLQPLKKKQAAAEAEAARRQVAGALPLVTSKEDTTKTLKPIPITSTGTIGWLASKPECQLEIYTSWISKIPLRSPDAWDKKDFVGPTK